MVRWPQSEPLDVLESSYFVAFIRMRASVDSISCTSFDFIANVEVKCYEVPVFENYCQHTLVHFVASAVQHSYLRYTDYTVSEYTVSEYTVYDYTVSEYATVLTE